MRVKRAERLPKGMKRVISRARIARRLKALAREIQSDLREAPRPLAVIVLKGAFIFGADLLRAMQPEFPIEVAFLHCQSYGSRTTSSGKVTLLQDVDADLKGRTVLLIDDILDTGLTLNFLVKHLRQRGAGDVKVCVLLERKNVKRTVACQADFVGFHADHGFYVGYGLDYDGKYRHLPDVAAVETR